MDALVEKERKLFIKENKIKQDLFLSRREDYYIGIEKAFDDAFNQYARRTKHSYATDKKTLMEPVLEKLYQYFTTDSADFDNCFKECIKLSMEILDNQRYGIAQKFVNMSFKYLYCYDDIATYESKFERCHLPLDKYTIMWVRSLKIKEINSALSNINNAWTNISKELYEEIQKQVSAKLSNNINYKISYNPNAKNEGLYLLPQNRLETEFIVWHQEKLNELHKMFSKASAEDWDRLGITKIS